MFWIGKGRKLCSGVMWCWFSIGVVGNGNCALFLSYPMHWNLVCWSLFHFFLVHFFGLPLVLSLTVHSHDPTRHYYEDDDDGDRDGDGGKGKSGVEVFIFKTDRVEDDNEDDD